jgi:5,10-methenyltetrahydromethanopterin hydrogenase
MAAKTKAPKYDPNGQFRALKRIVHPEAVHADGTIDPARESDADVTFTMKHRADQPDLVAKLVDEIKAIEPVKAQSK